jgi:uncharacterized protein YjbI with pentapeptide repeats
MTSKFKGRMGLHNKRVWDNGFRGIYILGGVIEETKLELSNLEGANLEGANLKGANLKGANLEGANLGNGCQTLNCV